jgi:GTP diphosphokinase / guanosine-3',5'-bis(diphosphate) 3'-diphosphatase
LDELIDRIKAISASKLDVALIEKAYTFAKAAHAGQARQSGEPYFMHPCAVATILLDMDMDATTIASALLHDVVEDTVVTLEEIKEKFGAEVALIVDGLTKISKVEYSNNEERQAESIRKMLLAMSEDIRVILIKLADRLHNMRTLDACPREKQIAVAKETKDIYAPLAHRLGIFRMKVELEDLALRYIDPEGYEEVAKEMQETVSSRKSEMDLVITQIQERLDEAGIKATIDGRLKHYASIYRKMRDQHKLLEQIYDLSAVRIIVDNVKDCYGVLGIVHTLWRPLPGRFKDYIAVPKANLYQSLHTTVIGRGGAPFEVQIRTWEMHRTAEYGIAAHWKYKEKETGTDTKFDNKLAWLRQILEWQNETRDAREFMDSLKLDLFFTEVFVFTPKGDVVDLPKGASPIDFAYMIHSAVGNKCVGAKVNGKMVNLNAELKTGDIVEIITSNTSRGPSRDWLNIVKTPQARNKIRAWFKKEYKDENIEKGQDMLEEAAKRSAVTLGDLLKPEWLQKVFKKFTLNSVEDMYAAVGYGGITTGQIMQRLLAEYRRDMKAKQAAEAPAEGKTVKKPTASRGIIVKGHKNMLVRFAQCCNPVPHDEITGFITRGRGVSIHRMDCPSICDLMNDPSRFIDVAWEDDADSAYSARLHLSAYDRPGLIVDIYKAIDAVDAHMIEVNAKVTAKGVANMAMLIQIKDKVQLETLIKTFRKLPEMIEVHRGT